VDHDDTVGPRTARLVEINTGPSTREDLEALYGQVWNPDQLAAEFTVEQFLSPYVVVRRTADGVRGSLEFRHDPRLYFNWKPE
jgi:hypothetical protein